MPLPMFLPINETGQQVTLPGLAPDPSGAAPLFPPGTYPIMGSGEFTATLYPLADPLPPAPVPLPPEVAPVALPPGSMPGGILPQPMAPPAPLEMPMMPLDSPASPGIAPLGDPLPTSVMSYQQAWPPFPEPTPPVPLPPPEPMPFPFVDAQGPLLMPLPDVPLPLPGLPTLPDVALPVPDMPLPPAAPLTGAQTSGMQSLLEALSSQRDQERNLRDFSQERSILRAPVPQPNLGRVIWSQSFGDEPRVG